MRTLFRIFVVLLPWPVRLHVLRRVYGYQIHRTARIGWSWIFPEHLTMGPRARIGHGNVAIHLERLEMGADSTIERRNWITGFPRGNRRHFGHDIGRNPALLLGEHAAITKNHLFDCTAEIAIGRFTTIAGYGSQFMTHSIDLVENRQGARPISIGEYCFVGTAVVVLGGAQLPARSVLGAKALLNRAYSQTGQLYAGVPARAVKALPTDAAYFQREHGFVY